MWPRPSRSSGIEPENPVAGGKAEAFIAGRGKAVYPGKVVDPGAGLPGDFLGCGPSKPVSMTMISWTRSATEARQAPQVQLLILDR